MPKQLNNKQSVSPNKNPRKIKSSASPPSMHGPGSKSFPSSVPRTDVNRSPVLPGRLLTKKN